MGSGKTRVGKRLSSDLGLTFVDVDKVIVKKMNMSVKEILQKFGEPYYRALETMTVKAQMCIRDRCNVYLDLFHGLTHAFYPIEILNEWYLYQHDGIHTGTTVIRTVFFVIIKNTALLIFIIAEKRFQQ